MFEEHRGVIACFGAVIGMAVGSTFGGTLRPQISHSH